jgi:hypothetical protein
MNRELEEIKKQSELDLKNIKETYEEKLKQLSNESGNFD